MSTMNRIRTKLVVPSADQAMDWYRTALEAEVGQRHDVDGAVVYAELTALGTLLTLKDADSYGQRGRPPAGPVRDPVDHLRSAT